MIRAIKIYYPFMIYMFVIISMYFFCFFLFPRINVFLAFWGYIFIYIYILVLVWVGGVLIGRKVLLRMDSPNWWKMLLYAIISGILMFFVGTLEFIFRNLNYSLNTTFYNYIYYIESIQSKTISVGTFCSFLLGELWENKRRKLK